CRGIPLAVRQRPSAARKKPDSVWPISQTPGRRSRRVQKSGDTVGTIRGDAVSRNSLDSVYRIVAIKNPDAVWKIAQTVSAKFGVPAARGGGPCPVYWTLVS